MFDEPRFTAYASWFTMMTLAFSWVFIISLLLVISPFSTAYMQLDLQVLEWIHSHFHFPQSDQPYICWSLGSTVSCCMWESIPLSVGRGVRGGNRCLRHCSLPAHADGSCSILDTYSWVHIKDEMHRTLLKIEAHTANEILDVISIEFHTLALFLDISSVKALIQDQQVHTL